MMRILIKALAGLVSFTMAVASSAQAGAVTVTSTSVVDGVFHYEISENAGGSISGTGAAPGSTTSIAAPGESVADYFTIYDFSGFTGAHVEPAGWTFVASLVGSTDSSLVAVDSATVLNLTWYKTGGSTGAGPFVISGFSATSTFRGTLPTGRWTSEDTQNGGSAASSTSAALGFATVPAALNPCSDNQGPFSAARVTKGDFNGDGMTDLLLRSSTTGQNMVWLMNGLNAAWCSLPTIGDTNWEAKGVGDADGDGRADVIWRNRVTGQYIEWLMSGSTVTHAAYLPMITDTDWVTAGVGDLNGDGKVDVILRHKISGQNLGLLMDGLTMIGSASLPTIADTNWEIKALADLSGDGKADVLWRNKSTGQDIGWLMDGLTVVNTALLPTIADTNWQIAGTGDLNGDGKADVLLRNTANGQNIGWLMNGLTVVVSAFLPTIADTSFEIRAIGDINGDGMADVILQHSAGQIVGWLMNGLTVSTSAFLPGPGWQVVGPR